MAIAFFQFLRFLKKGYRKMNKMKMVSVAAIGALVLAGSPVAMAGIAGTGHDFSTASWNNGGKGGTLCGVCHVAHNAYTPQLIPLWSHVTSSDSGYQMYTSATFNAASTISAAPSGPSKACLSCHDGTVAVDSFGGTAGVTNGSTYIDAVNPGAKLSKDLRNDHPISFTYDTALANADGYLYDPSTKPVAYVGDGTRKISEVMLTGGKMECSSCHDVHAQKGDSADDSNLLIIGGQFHQGSKLCLTCHNK